MNVRYYTTSVPITYCSRNVNCCRLWFYGLIFVRAYNIAMIYRVRINYRSISLRHNLSRKCRKIVKFVSITHGERNIWNGPIVATAISRKKLKLVLDRRHLLHLATPVTRPWQCVISSCGVSSRTVFTCRHFQRHYQNCREHINTAIGNVTQDVLETVWREWEYRLDICRVTRGAHFRYI